MELATIKQLTDEGEGEFEKSTRMIEEFPEFVWVPEFLSVTGSYFYEREGDRKANDVDVLVRANVDEKGRFFVILGPDLRLKIDRILEARTGLPSEHWHGQPHGPNWRHQPICDLVLKPRKPEIREINEPDFEREFYKVMHWPHYCDFGCNYYSKFVKQHREFNTKEFEEFVIQFNRADRDSGELQDIAKFEILRLAEEFAEKKGFPFKKDERYVHIFEKQEDQQIVGGVVYEPDKEDAQGDSASAEEIKRAAYGFMENAQKFLYLHQGSPIDAKVLESYLAPVNFYMETELVKKGSWVLITRVLDKEIWAQIKSGEITGYSMAGRAKSDSNYS